MDSSNSYKPPNLWDDRMSPRGSSTANYSQRNNTASTRLNENRDRGNLKNQPDDYDDLYVDDTMDIVDDDETMSSSFYSASSSPRDGPTSLPDEKTAGDNPAQQPGDTSGNIPELDLVERIDGMFRILDLISERGSGGLVDKIIIAQDQFSHFINELYPGSYRSLTKIDFHLLDKGVVKPMGIYGSKAEIVRLMRSIGAIDEEIEKLLLACRDVSSSVSKPDLRPGLYALLSPKRHGVDRNLYIIFWPEETTWNDDAISTVARNRVTFLRYLTQTTDQVIALVSDEHCKKLVWADEQDSIVSPLEEDDSERLFTFEVSKTNEQEEDVKFYPGFIIKHTALKTLTAIEGVEDAKLEARFVGGESHQAIMSGEYVPASKENRRCWESYTSTHLRSFLTNAENILRFDYHLTNDSIKILVENGLKSRYGSAVKIWEDGQKNLERDSKEFKAKSEADIRNKIEADSNKLSSALEYMLIAKILEMFPTLERCRLQAPDQLTEMTAEDRQIFISELFTLHTDIEKDNKFQEHVDVARSTKKTPRSFVKTKAIVLMCRDFFAVFELVEEKEKLLQLLISEDTKKAELFLRERTIENTSNSKRSTFGWVKNIIFWDTSTSSSGVIKEAKESALKMDDHEYVNILDSIVKDEPILAGVAEESMKCLNEHLADQTQAALKKLKARTQYLQEDVYKQELSKQRRIVDAQAEKALREQLLSALNGSEDGGGPDGENAPHVITVENVESPRTYSYSSYAHFKLSLTHYTRKDPVIRYSIDPLLISQRDKHEMQMRPDHIPSPSFATRFSTKFSLPVECSIKQLYLLDGDRCLLIVDDHRGHLKIYLEELTCIDGAIRQGSHGSKKVLHKDKMGENAVVTFDERKRMIAVCGCDRVKGVVQLHTFVFDERFTSLQGQGTAINLTAWYEESPSIHLMCFVSGTEEIALVEAGGRTRIFSFITQQFRPAVLLLPSCPSAAFSSPDGACFITVLKSLETSHVYAHHWSSFGSGQGFHYDISGSLDKVHMITSLGQRNNVQLLGINIQTGTCQSIRMDIKRQITEYLFRERGAREFQVGNGRSTMHNCLLDCHSDVWTRYPVIPAISRQTILSEDRRKSKCLRYIAIDSHPAFARYFLDMVQTVERTTRKPIGSILGGISVSGESFSSLVSRLNRDADWQGISSFMAGEWLVNLICLIPIHIAVARDNRFIPLKDGIWTTEHERSLLGAEVGRIVDSISFGWYESIFQSYMSTKPVRVVSSMGEQSVGKSYALNHLVDTSFAGSAMRTTEGVWMSVTPTRESLVVALDFEGVHSIERSAQEDTLLVLFNTAISNLVLFRNNFAISRDITNLFQSFQSSSSVLDPAANPTLFQSTLVIIIKDVIDSDKTEIKQEFALKFQKIVQEEQGSNFLTRLHKGQLSIVPWPVIESRQFYTLFGVLRKRLESTPPTYHEAGRFLHTLKVLMAKLKANDWGSMSQSLASHRGQHLLSLLPHALAFGATEIEPEYEQLRNFDTNSIIVADDTNARFWVKSLDEGKDADEQDILLRKLCESWPDFGTRTFCEEVIWMERLTEYLDDLVTRRLAHVLQWIESNIDRFASGGTHAALDKLRRAYEEESVEIKRTTQFCKTQCADCHLLCIRSKYHDGNHNCSTNHKCPHSCQFVEEHSESEIPEICSIPAGHGGEHICDVMPHLCGEICMLESKRGCQGRCMKVASHSDGEHLCSARIHACGQSCDLDQIALSKKAKPPCGGFCTMPWNEDHDHHVCDKGLMCPFSCQLCKRLCAIADHLHGLDLSAVHICDQEHICKKACAATGICEIETQPQSIEATFTGQHETFQYTKYSQVAKRLPCVVPIPPGELRHDGKHSHSTEENPFHYCETRCDNCGYLCTLPQGHPQQEHETSHGSMSRTNWAIAGPDGVFELDGHKFGSNDDGAPMLCSLFCRNMGRHVHIDYCRADDAKSCNHAETKHIAEKMTPNPDKPKDWITHNLSWSRLGFKDPYSKDERANFAKCDAMCSGPEHEATASRPAQPSYCTLPVFHPPQRVNPSGLGHVSNDGHAFTCKNPSVMQQAFHVIFVIDQSGSMTATDRGPLANTPSTARIRRSANNRFGAVCSSLHAFWTARMPVGAANQSSAARRDAYSAILFDSSIKNCFTNDFTRSPDELLDVILGSQLWGGTNFDLALQAAQNVMTTNWSTERTPVVIFLSDGECHVSDARIYDVCRAAVRLGKSLSFHSVSFGPDTSSQSLRRMAQIAREVAASAPRDPLLPAAAQVDSQYTVALDTVNLAETFLGIAESLRKPHASLLRSSH